MTEEDIDTSWHMAMTRHESEKLVLFCEAHQISKQELLNNSLTLFIWAMGEVEDGRMIASCDEVKQSYREVTLPIFSKVQNARHAQPSEPTDPPLQA